MATSRALRVAALLPRAAGWLQLLQECADGGGVQVGQVELGGQLAGLLVEVAEQQRECVSVGRR